MGQNRAFAVVNGMSSVMTNIFNIAIKLIRVFSSNWLNMVQLQHDFSLFKVKIDEIYRAVQDFKNIKWYCFFNPHLISKILFSDPLLN